MLIGRNLLRHANSNSKIKLGLSSIYLLIIFKGHDITDPYCRKYFSSKITYFRLHKPDLQKVNGGDVVPNIPMVFD